MMPDILVFLNITAENTLLSYIKGEGKTNQNHKAEDKNEQ